MCNKMNKHLLRTIIILLIMTFSITNTASVFAVLDNNVDKQLIIKDEYLSLKYLLKADNAGNAFYDIINHWAEDVMKELNYMDILKGLPDGTMSPAQTITRAEFVTMIARAIELPITDTYMKYYNDISASSWSYYHVSAAKQSGIIDVFGENNFYPERVITREEMAVIAAKAAGSIPILSKPISFKDINSSYKYWDSINKVSSLGIIKGLPDGSFNPYGNASRAEAAVIIQRILDLKDYNLEEDKVLTETAEAYEIDIINSANQGDFSLRKPLYMSIGREKNLNIVRANEIKNIANSGLMSINRTVSDFSAQIEKKSVYLAEIAISYNLKVEDTSLEADYSVDKKLYLIRKDARWIIYNSAAQYTLTSTEEEDNDVEHNPTDKINLTWHYLHSSTPDMSQTPKIAGLNVISPTWFTLTNADGEIKSIGNAEYVKWAKKNGYKVWALATNDFNKEMTSKMLHNSQARKKAIDSLLYYAELYKIDGINIDFENMYTSDKYLFTQFVKELYERASANNLTISVDVTIITVNSNWSECYDREALAKVSDYIMLMAYDQYWAGSPVSGSVAQLTWVEQSLIKVLKQVPNEKLILGLPFYTRLWKEEYSPAENKTIVTSKAISMGAAEAVIKENNAIKVWDEKSGQYYVYYYKDGATYKIWLEDERSIELKTQLVNKYNLAGVSSWRWGYERPEIWDVINKNLK